MLETYIINISQVLGFNYQFLFVFSISYAFSFILETIATNFLTL